jgi:hypothetical protein
MMMLNSHTVDTNVYMSMSARSSGLGCGLLGCGGWLMGNLFDGVNEI